MKLPSLFPVAFFAGGILLSIELKKFAQASPRIVLFAALLFLLFGYVALRRNRILTAAAFAAVAWLVLGLAASNLERASVPANLASTLIESGKLDSATALRWRGRLRSDPLNCRGARAMKLIWRKLNLPRGSRPWQAACA